MRMPTCLVLAMLAMQPRLAAEEAIEFVHRIAMGSATMKSDDADRIRQEWAKAIDPSAAPAKPTPAAALGAHGIPVRRVKTQRKKAG